MLRQPETIGAAAAIVNAEDFLEPGLGRLFVHLVEMVATGKPINPATMREAFYRLSHWPAVLDAVELADEDPGDDPGALAAEVVQAAADRRAEYARQLAALDGKPARAYTEAGERRRTLRPAILADRAMLLSSVAS